MTERWHRTRDLVGLPGMPAGPRPIRLHGARRGWTCREAKWGSRAVLEWLESSLPGETQRALREARGEPVDASDAPPPLLPDDGRAAVADARAEILAAFVRWHASDGSGSKLVAALRSFSALYAAGEIPVSAETRALVPSAAWNTIQRWRRLFTARGALALLPASGGRRSAIDADPAILATCEAQLFDRWPHVTAPHIRDVIAADHPESEPPSLWTIQRWMRKWIPENAHALSANADPDGHRNRTQPAFGDAAAEIVELNQLWELDSTIADVMCADGKRYALIAGIDVWSRRAKAHLSPTSKATAIAALARRCLLDWGVPAAVKTDEGKDYTSKHLRRVFRDLRVAHLECHPYSPDEKPFIERFIGTMARGLFAHLEGFTGHNVAEAAKLRSRKSFAARRGQGPVAQFRCALTVEELQARIDTWCESKYGRKPHSGLGGISPFEKAASWTGERRRVEERGLDVLLAEAAGNGRRKVNKKGISVDGGRYIAAELGRWVDHWVHVRRCPSDYGRIFVFAEEDDGHRFLCIAEDPLRTGIDRQEVARQARALAREENTKARKRARTLVKKTEAAAAMDRVLERATAAAEQVVAFPARAEIHETDALAAAAEAEDAAALADTPPERRSTGTGDANIELFKRFHREGLYD